MVRLCLLLGCVVLLGACREKAPEEGALRVSVKYGSFKPACVRVEVQDAQGHTGATDIPQSQFKERETREVLVAVLRKAEWDRELSVTVSSLASVKDGRCDGAVLERIASQNIPVPPKAFARHDVTLEAEDGDGDGAPVNVEWAEGSDCDDDDPRFRPGAEETCTGTDDFNCNTLKGCQETGCRAAACDDGNLCTTEDHCEGNGVEAKCLGTARQCNASSCTRSVCDQATGQCSSSPTPAGTSCVDANACTEGDTCNGSGMCVSGTPAPCPEQKCFLAATSGCPGNNSCSYPPDPAQVGDFCMAPSGNSTGVCRSGDGACSSFPYKPSNFDPDAVDPADLADLFTSGAVTFNSDTLTWAPDGSVTNSNLIKPRVLPQVGGALAPVLIPVSEMDLGGTLTLVGSRPVILAVYGDAVLDEAILASSNFKNGTPVAGAGHNQLCDTSKGKDGTFSGRQGGGGGGAGGGTEGASGGRGPSTSATGGEFGARRTVEAVPLIGGCPGGNGAGSGAATGGAGGTGGGAVQVSVKGTLTLESVVSASARGGEGGKAVLAGSAAGGGGGGGGGRVVLEGFQISIKGSARLTANGGGGGEGGGAHSTDAKTGEAGDDGTETGTGRVNGGSGDSRLGGDGGMGGAKAGNPSIGSNGDPQGSGDPGGGGGGGGGGAVGLIHLRSFKTCQLTGGYVISPAPLGDCPAP